MDINGLISLVIALLLLGLAFYLIVWLIGWIGVPEPFNKIIKAVVGIVFVLLILGMLFGGVHAPVLYHR